MSLLGWSALVVVSFFVEAAAGFGSMVVALALGAMVLPVDALLGVLVPVNLVLSCLLVARDWEAVSWSFLVRRALPLLTLGALMGAALAGQLDVALARPVLGVFVVVVACLQLGQALMPGSGARPLSPIARVLGLLGAGVAHGVFASGGPLVVFVAARELADKRAFRATLSALWVVLNALVLPRLISGGSLAFSTLSTSAVLLGPLALGSALGQWAHSRLDERRFRLAVASVLGLAGVLLVFGSSRVTAPVAVCSVGSRP